MTIQRTAPQGHPYPQPSDQPLVPADLQALAQSVSDRSGVPVYANNELASADPYLGMVVYNSTYNMLYLCVSVTPVDWQPLAGVYWTANSSVTSRVVEGSVIFDSADKYLKLRVGGGFETITKGTRIFFGGTAPSNPQDNDLWFKF